MAVHDNRVHTVSAGNVAADDQLLSRVQPVLGPRPTAFSRLVATVLRFATTPSSACARAALSMSAADASK
jgi:hypothetical protein